MPYFHFYLLSPGLVLATAAHISWCHIEAPAYQQVRRDVTGNEHVASAGRHVPPVSAERRLSNKHSRAFSSVAAPGHRTGA